MLEPPTGQEWVFEMVENILIEVLGSFAENERKAIKKRQAEGIAAAKSNGVAFGRPVVEKPDNWDEVYQRWQNKEITATEAMSLTGVKRTTFYKLVNQQC